MGLELGRLATRLDGRPPESVRLSMLADRHRQPDGLVDQEPRRLHREVGGNESPGSIEFQFDIAGDVWGNWIGNVFGAGIITWNTPFLFRTRPAGSRLLVCGPANAFKGNAQPLTAIIESDWISMSFTMNWKIMRPYEPVRFEAGEPLFQAIPMATNICADLEKSAVNYKRLADDPELSRPTTSGTARETSSWR